MCVLINNKIRIDSVVELCRKVTRRQHHFMMVVCTQTLWGAPYTEVATGSGMIVCEQSPAKSAVVNLVSTDTRPPYTIKKIRAYKQLRAAFDVPELQTNPLTIFFKIDMDSEMTSVHTLCARHPESECHPPSPLQTFDGPFCSTN
jgi:hypothetical protein